MATTGAMKGVAVTSLSAATTGTGTAIALPITCKNPRVNLAGSGTISGGTVVLEEANAPDYSGTWSTLYTVVGTTLSGGAQQVVHIFGTMAFFRARISSTILGGGNVTANLITN